MNNNIFYLNNSGSRWVVLPKPKVPVILPDGKKAYRTAICYEAFGNFATVQISYKGIKRFYLFEDDGIKINPLRHVKGFF